MQMGLGKTAQAIAFLESIRTVGGVEGPYLIVAPLTTLNHWKRELEKWTSMVRQKETQQGWIMFTLQTTTFLRLGYSRAKSGARGWDCILPEVYLDPERHQL